MTQPRRTVWIDIDWNAPDAGMEIVDALIRAVRSSDPVELALPADGLSEKDAAERLIQLLVQLPDFSDRRTETPTIGVHEGSIPAGATVLQTGSPVARERALEQVHELRREFATFAAVTPVMNRVGWAERWRPEPGFHHLVVDNASTDGTAEVLRTAGADVVVQTEPVGRVQNWVSAMHHFRDRTSLSWLKWLFAGDELLPGAASMLEAATAAFPEARLIVAEYIWRYPDGQSHHWRQMDVTRLVMPDEALELSARSGNWFGSPIGHAFHRDVLDEVEFGAQPWVADWQACLSIARRHPVLYIAQPVGIFDVGSRQFFHARQQEVYSLVQALSMRQQSLDALRERSPGRRDLRVIEREVDEHAARSLVERVQARHHRVAVVGERSIDPSGQSSESDDGPVIAVHAPRAIDPSGRDFEGYAPEFAARYARYAYMPQLDGHPEVVGRRARGERLAVEGLELITSAKELNRVADVLVCFQGRPYLQEMAPPREFTGLKAYHVWEFVFHAPAANQALVDGRVDLVLGYCRHDEYSDFFRSLYEPFIGRTIAVPFGFAPRFQPVVPFHERIQKAVGLGAVNPVDDPLCPPGQLDAYVAFYPGERWTHRWRRALLEHAGDLTDVLDAKFPVFPETKDYSYDAVAMLNGYAMFANDPGLMAFPPARTYEGAACGTLLVGENTAVHSDLGFEHGVNALLHVPGDIEDFRRVVSEARAEPEHMAAMAAAGRRLMEERYTHAAVAATLHGQLCSAFAGRGS